MNVDEIVHKMLNATPNGRWQQYSGNPVHLVITGGEPLLGWQRSYPALLSHPGMQDLDFLTFETNGTQELSDDFFDYLQEWMTEIREPYNDFLGRFREVQFSVSPKLSVSGEKFEDAIKPEVVLQYQQLGVVYLKFVINKVEDFDELDHAVRAYRNEGFMGQVYVMPEGGTTLGYNKNRVHIADEALARGWYYSPRLHVDLWGNGWGK
jgi:7-carboxy-7-deazaguanine synthase